MTKISVIIPCYNQEDYIAECLDRSYFYTGVDLQYGDEILTLSTCDFSMFSDMRLVVMARKVREDESLSMNPEEFIDNTGFDENNGTAYVYTVPVVSVEETEEYAGEFFARFDSGIDEGRTDIYDESVFYWNDDPDNTISLRIDYEGNKISYTNFQISFLDSAMIPDENADEEELREAIEALGFMVPADCTFTNKGYGNYLFRADCVIVGDYVYDGYINCNVAEGGGIKNLDYNLIKCSAYKEFPIISEAEAYERIADGIFRYEPAYEPRNITVNDIFLAYEVDSKGFYQPIYILECTIDGQDTRLYTPAMK